MKLENKHVLSDFIHYDQFELNNYLTFLFNQFKNSQKYRIIDDHQWRKRTRESNLKNEKYREI